jgi:hypothetical protein
MRFRILRLLGLFILGIVLLTARHYLGDGRYVPNLFALYPLWFWGLMVALVAVGYAIILNSINQDKNREWRWGILFIAAVNGYVLAMPYFHDFAFAGAWDPIVHYSRSFNILKTGRPDNLNIYPISHLWVVFFNYLSGVPLNKIILLLPVGMYLVYLANLKFAANVFFKARRVQIMSLALALPLLYGTFGLFYRPTQNGFYFVPLFLGLVHQLFFYPSSTKVRVLFILQLIIVPFLHPWFLISSIVIVSLYTIFHRHAVEQAKDGRKFVYMTSLGGLLLSFFWFWNSQTIQVVSTRIIGSAVYGFSKAHSLNQYLQNAARAQLSFQKILSLMFFRYGGAILFLTLAGMIILWMLRLARRGELHFRPEFKSLLLYGLVFGGLAFSTLFVDLSAIDVLRLSSYVILAAIFMIASILARVNLSSGLIGGALTVILVIGALGTHPIPASGQPNQNVTYSQIEAVQSFLTTPSGVNHRDVYSAFRGARYIFSSFTRDEVRFVRRTSQDSFDLLIPWQLEFEETENTIGSGDYIWLPEYDFVYYTEVWPEDGRLSLDAFARLDADSNWNMIYSSEDFRIYKRRWQLAP